MIGTSFVIANCYDLELSNEKTQDLDIETVFCDGCKKMLFSSESYCTLARLRTNVLVDPGKKSCQVYINMYSCMISCMSECNWSKLLGQMDAHLVDNKMYILYLVKGLFCLLLILSCSTCYFNLVKL